MNQHLLTIHIGNVDMSKTFNEISEGSRVPSVMCYAVNEIKPWVFFNEMV